MSYKCKPQLSTLLLCGELLTVSLPLQAALPSSTFRCGRCKQLQAVQNAPATAQQHLEALFHQLEALMEHAELREQMEASNGKMLAVLLTRNSRDEVVVLQAFSGDLGGTPNWPGFVPYSSAQVWCSMSSAIADSSSGAEDDFPDHGTKTAFELPI